jgi:EAL domain-containing protein (putative c-di-GMP-specific phosphodiesterase class I)
MPFTTVVQEPNWKTIRKNGCYLFQGSFFLSFFGKSKCAAFIDTNEKYKNSGDKKENIQKIKSKSNCLHCTEAQFYSR